jgi:hypothetical protein
MSQRKCYCKPDKNGEHPSACAKRLAAMKLPDHNDENLLRAAYQIYLKTRIIMVDNNKLYAYNSKYQGSKTQARI